MRAITYTRTGDPEVLTLVDKPLARPRAGRGARADPPLRREPDRLEVAPRQRARDAGRAGAGARTRTAPAWSTPSAPGVEAGLVGLRVWVWEAAHQRPEGTAQEYALVRARTCVTLPDSAGFDLGAGLGVPFVTAHRCLTVAEDGPTPARARAPWPGGRCSSPAGAGAVGNAAIQLARWSDATVHHHGQRPGEGPPRRRGRRRPRHRLQGRGRGARRAPDRAARRAHHRRGRRRPPTPRSTPPCSPTAARSRSTPTTAATRSRCRCGRRW